MILIHYPVPYQRAKINTWHSYQATGYNDRLDGNDNIHYIGNPHNSAQSTSYNDTAV